MKLVITMAVAFGILACASVETQGDYDQAYDFSRLETWNWMPEPGVTRGPTGERNPLIERRIKEAVERELGAKGYRLTPGESVDFRVAFFASAEEKLDVSTTYDYFGYRWRVPVGRTEVHQYTEGTIILDIVDGTRNELVWRGTASGVVRGGEPDEVTERINKAVAEELKDFPPR